MNTETENKLEVANEIARQIGRRAFLMMGTTFQVGDTKSLAFNVRGSRMCNKIRVTLELSDLYTVECFKMRGTEIKTVATVEGVYAENLNAVIERETKLFLSL